VKNDKLPDLDFVYTIPKSVEKGGLREILAALKTFPGVTHVCVYIYDLGTADFREYPVEAFSDMPEKLSEYYQLGGPLGSTYHVFQLSAE